MTKHVQKDLHIYASEFCHEEVWIVGNADALKALKEAIEKALLDGSASASAMTNDGEGYKVLVMQTSGLSPSFDELMLPYSKNEFERSGTHPFASCGSERYKELMRDELDVPLESEEDEDCHHIRG